MLYSDLRNDEAVFLTASDEIRTAVWPLGTTTNRPARFEFASKWKWNHNVAHERIASISRLETSSAYRRWYSMTGRRIARVQYHSISYTASSISLPRRWWRAFSLDNAHTGNERSSKYTIVVVLEYGQLCYTFCVTTQPRYATCEDAGRPERSWIEWVGWHHDCCHGDSLILQARPGGGGGM